MSKKVDRKNKHIDGKVNPKYGLQNPEFVDMYENSKPYHDFSFKLPRYKVMDYDLERARNNTKLQHHMQYSNWDVLETQTQIKRLAKEYAIQRTLTPQQKSAIITTWRGTKVNKKTGKVRILGIKRFVDSDNNFQFLEIKNANRMPRFHNFKTTKKGVFIEVENQIVTEVWNKGRKVLNFEQILTPAQEKKKKIRIKEGKIIHTIKTQLFTFKKGINIKNYIESLLEEYKPKSVLLYINGYASKSTYTMNQFMRYMYSQMEDLNMQGREIPYSGLFLSWY